MSYKIKQEFNNPESIDNNIKIGIVVSEWNKTVTGALLKGAVDLLVANNIPQSNILIKNVPGSFELPLGAKYLLDFTDVDAVICLGCVIQGETRHFDFICQSVSLSISRLNLDYSKPVIFGVLTPNNMQQALERAGGKYGNKGEEAALAAIKMISLHNSLLK
jgi:6,7-dimethyl-8-ribityllumazine synthase